VNPWKYSRQESVTAHGKEYSGLSKKTG
jgi:hypothetical protein